jgi:hypothetical protein
MLCVEDWEGTRRPNWEVFLILDVWDDDDLDYVEGDRHRRN